MRDRSLAVHGCRLDEDVFRSVVPPIYLSTVFEYGFGIKYTDRGTELKYSREDNPTVRILERVLAKLERGTDSIVTSSGLSAILVALTYYLCRNDKVLVPLEVYGGTRKLIEELSRSIGFEITWCFPNTEDIVESIVSVRPKLVLTESITNPNVRVVDVGEVAKAAKDAGSVLLVDNTIATPVLIKPLTLGASVVIHSLTKFLAGHNDVLGGAVIANDEEVIAKLWEIRRLRGVIIQAFDAYLAIRGVKTLFPRFEYASKNALAVAEFLEDHPRVLEVRYPGLSSSPYKSLADRLFIAKGIYGPLMSFVVKGGEKEALKVLRRVRLIRPSTSFGGVESIISYPLLGSVRDLPEDIRRKLGICEGLLRLSVGIEDVNDLIEDLDNALSG